MASGGWSRVEGHQVTVPASARSAGRGAHRRGRRHVERCGGEHDQGLVGARRQPAPDGRSLRESRSGTPRTGWRWTAWPHRPWRARTRWSSL